MTLSTPTLVFIGCAIIFAAGLHLWQRHEARLTKKLNTVDLGGDLDDVELVMDIEETFGIKIADEDAEKLVTVGQLYDLVSKKLEHRTDLDPVWALVCEITRIHSGSRDPIDKETTFFPDNAKERDP